MTDYLEIIITVTGQEQADLLVARLSDIGFEGFEESRTTLKAYIPAGELDQAALDTIVSDELLTYTKSVIKQKNWNEEWEAGFEPVVIDKFCAIRASFHPPVNGVKYEIIITPKMSFGTGHHATTYMMIDAMSSIDFHGKTVLDFGTGTGVLAILAEKLGASAVEAVDNDDWSIENGKENMQMNDSKIICLYKAESLKTAAACDVLLANINKNVITAHFKSLKAHLLPGATLLLSGLLSGDLEDIKELVQSENLDIKEVKERNSWICVAIANK